MHISRTVQKIKSITAIQMFRKHPEVKTFLWGGEFWTDGYYINTVGQYGNLHMIQNYVKNQGAKGYKQVYQQTRSLFQDLGEATIPRRSAAEGTACCGVVHYV